MRKWLFIFLLFPCLAWAGFSVDGVTDPASVDGATEPASVDSVDSDYGDDCGITDSQETPDTSGFLGYNADYQYVETDFIADGTGTYPVKTVYVSLLDVGSPSNTITLALCTDSGGNPDSCTNADGTLDGSTTTGTLAWYKFNFSTGYNLTNGTTYHIRLYASAVSTSNYHKWGYCTSASGREIRRSSDGSSWTSWGSDNQGNFKLTTCLE